VVLKSQRRSEFWAMKRCGMKGSHMRLTTMQNGVHHVTVPGHAPLKVGTLLGGILKPIAVHHGLSLDELLKRLDL
jgi:hypothetical protein